MSPGHETLLALRLPHRQVCDGASSARPCSEIRASRLPSPWLLPLLTVQHKSLRLQPLQLILNSPALGVQETAQDQAREGLPQRPTHMLGLVGAFTVATRQHSICINAATAWCHLLGTWSWSRSWEKLTAVSENASRARLPQPVSALHPFLVTRPGLARAAEAWTSTATAHGLVTAGLGKAQGQHLQLCLASHAGLPSPSPVRLCGQLRLEVLGAHSVRHWSAGSEGHF